MGKSYQMNYQNMPYTTARHSNAYNLQLYTNGSNQVIKNKINALTANDPLGIFRWEILMNWLKFYTNCFKFENSKILERIRPKIISNLFWSGNVGVSKVGNNYYPFGLTKTTTNYDGLIENAVGKVTAINKEEYNLTLTKRNAAFCQANVYSFPLLVGLDELMKPIYDIWSYLTPELMNSISKLVFQMPKKQKGKKEEEIKVEHITGQNGQLVTLVWGTMAKPVEIKSESSNETIWNHINKVKNFAYSIRGRQINISEKDERNLNAEVTLNSVDFEIILNDYLHYLEIFVEEWNLLTGENVSIKSIYQSKEEKENVRNNDDTEI